MLHAVIQIILFRNTVVGYSCSLANIELMSIEALGFAEEPFAVAVAFNFLL